MNTILISVAVLGSIGIIFGLILSFAAIKLKVSEDPKLAALKALMPGANCGACGYPGCNGFAEAFFEGNAPADGCPVGRRRGLGEQMIEVMAS
jgi:electron transport complex protein RnfB